MNQVSFPGFPSRLDISTLLIHNGLTINVIVQLTKYSTDTT
jgi:hypothetical protein